MSERDTLPSRQLAVLLEVSQFCSEALLISMLNVKNGFSCHCCVFAKNVLNESSYGAGGGGSSGIRQIQLERQMFCKTAPSDPSKSQYQEKQKLGNHSRCLILHQVEWKKQWKRFRGQLENFVCGIYIREYYWITKCFSVAMTIYKNTLLSGDVCSILVKVNWNFKQTISRECLWEELRFMEVPALCVCNCKTLLKKKKKALGF